MLQQHCVLLLIFNHSSSPQHGLKVSAESFVKNPFRIKLENAHHILLNSQDTFNYIGFILNYPLVHVQHLTTLLFVRQFAYHAAVIAATSSRPSLDHSLLP